MPEAELGGWESTVERADAAQRTLRIALVGKYVQLEDAYLSVSESLRHAGFQHGFRIDVDWVDSETLSDDDEAARRLAGADGILVPGGFGGRGIEGKIRAIRVARERRIPFLGICLGMQLAVCEFARHVADMEGANSTEFDPETPHPVIDLLPEQKEVSDLGGTMRLGADPIKLHADTRARELYDEAVIYERHRHRYEVNLFLRKRLEAAGLVCPARRRTSGSSRSSSSTTIRSSWRRSTTRSSSRGPSGPRRCSASSSARPASAPAGRAHRAGERARSLAAVRLS